ncbi:MAG TPA: phosphatase PAP2 family protein [Thermoanaerobaculia bacterium]|nr:phosphatase PAP2 family protein [Thermoanaerobaculia bacterium]
MRFRRFRPRLYELLVAANVLAVLGVLRAVGGLRSIPWELLAGLRVFLAPTAAFVAAAIAGRALAVALRDGGGRSRRFLAATLRPASSLDLVRLLVVASLVYFGHVWLKILVPFLNPRLHDAALARLDAALHFCLNPGPFALGLFPWPPLWRAMDVYYAGFVPLTLAGLAWFLTAPSRPDRARFAAGFALLWIAGAWLYVACPALGPCYVFPADWAEAGRSLPLQGGMQKLLMGHYRALLAAAARHETMRVMPLLGIGAMPSLHVAAHAFLALFARKRSRPLFVLFAAATALTFYGSLVTGWHYAVDGYAGLLLAFLCWRAGERRGTL